MIKANELRIGNYVSISPMYHKDDVRYVDLKMLNAIQNGFEVFGILLEKEVLEKCNFDYMDSFSCILKHWKFSIAVSGNSLIFHYEHHCNPKGRQFNIIYLHELQNFPLTNKEFEVKL